MEKLKQDSSVWRSAGRPRGGPTPTVLSKVRGRGPSLPVLTSVPSPPWPLTGRDFYQGFALPGAFFLHFQHTHKHTSTKVLIFHFTEVGTCTGPGTARSQQRHELNIPIFTREHISAEALHHQPLLLGISLYEHS